jgi:glycosyltransferase involved in cell wall biosynthesis
MIDLPVSVVIVSRGRPHSLARTLTGISQLQYWNFEVVVVADPDGIKSAQKLPFADTLKLVAFDEPNISAARNRGLLHAAGEIVAYIDDDAVPEPMWLRHLVAPAARSDVAAMGGGAMAFPFSGKPPALMHSVCIILYPSTRNRQL